MREGKEEQIPVLGKEGQHTFSTVEAGRWAVPSMRWMASSDTPERCGSSCSAMEM
jgi:hypothetical protein